MSRIATARILQNSARSISSHPPCALESRVVLFDQNTKYDRQAESSLPRQDSSLDLAPGQCFRPLTLLSPAQRPRWSIHDPDSWNWTSGRVRWFVSSARHNMD